METGLAYNWHRHYDASIGRYLQPDPLGMPNGPSRWAYVGNSPLMKVDPSGLYWVPGPGGNRWWCWGGNPLDCVLRPPPAARATILPDAVGTAYDASASAASWAAG
ncbi:RHS repeat-associated core domain-containing protein [Mesorhizobium ciceri]|uniref:RHS repeat-associated core domain-containing protein n=1 Tax=Mesorhizobium ciceri TaxID=39645 RepID=UPI0013E0648F